LVAIKQVLKAFSLSNQALSICVKLPDGVLIEQPTCQEMHVRSYPIPLSEETFQVGVDLPILDPMALAGFLFVLAAFVILYFEARHIRRLSGQISSDLRALSSSPGTREDFHFSEHAEAQLKIAEGLKHKAQAQVGELAEQVAHDLCAPIEALRAVLPEVPENIQTLISGPVTRVDEIATQLLAVSRGAGTTLTLTTPEETIPTDPILPIQEILAEKKMQYRNRSGIVLKLLQSADVAPLVCIQPNAFKRVLSNLVDNAVEAIIGSGVVTVELLTKEDLVTVLISDTGKGIPKEVLPRLMSKGATFGKADGTGLGLFHARTSIESWGGQISISSASGSGTQVSIDLPAYTTTAGQDIILIEDQPIVHRAWSFEAQRNHKRLHSFYSAEDFLKVARQFKPGALIFIDSNLGVETRGEILAQRIFELGFRDIYVTTASALRDVQHLPWIKGVLGKRPPWQLCHA
jgi:signal transduction histidine kinase